MPRAARGPVCGCPLAFTFLWPCEACREAPEKGGPGDPTELLEFTHPRPRRRACMLPVCLPPSPHLPVFPVCVL